MCFVQFARRSTLLVAAILPVSACGTGISLDPDSVERSRTKEDLDAETTDGPLSDDGGDASVEEDVATSSDGAGDRAVGVDRAADSPASALDAPNDVAADRSIDGVGPGGSDASRDAPSDTRADVSADTGIDRDAAATEDGPNDRSVVSSDAPGDVPQDTASEVATVDAADVCAVGCGPSDFEYYVDAAAAPGGDGSKEAPFRTISAAIQAHARGASHARKAYVAAGTYDEALGEVFPLVLRGLSIEGVGADKTFIVGSASYDHAGDGGPLNHQYMVTILTGDRVLPTKISRLTVRPVPPVPTPSYFGVYCDRGNATGEVASPAGQTHLDEVGIGPGFEMGAVAALSTKGSVTGCNLLMTRSTVTGVQLGVYAIGCNGRDTPGPVMLELGTDDPASGNTFTWIRGQGAAGEGVITGACVVRGSFQYNTFSDSSSGILVGESMEGPPPGSVHPFVFKHNTFSRLTSQGLVISGILLFADEVSDNRFYDFARVPNSITERAVAMRVVTPNVGKIRRNVFVGNDVGLQLDQEAQYTDVGRPDDPGQNVFTCNSGLDNWVGVDVAIRYPFMSPFSRRLANVRTSRFVRQADDDAGTGGEGGPDGDEGGAPRSLFFAGNTWDHDPPRLQSNDDLVENGAEIVREWAPPLTFDVSGSSLVTTPCPAGRQP